MNQREITSPETRHVESLSTVSSGEVDTELLFCGCLKCRDDGELWRSRATWFRHRKNREVQILQNLIPPPDPSYPTPIKRKLSTQGGGGNQPRKRRTVTAESNSGNIPTATQEYSGAPTSSQTTQASPASGGLSNVSKAL